MVGRLSQKLRRGDSCFLVYLVSYSAILSKWLASSPSAYLFHLIVVRLLWVATTTISTCIAWRYWSFVGKETFSLLLLCYQGDALNFVAKLEQHRGAVGCIGYSPDGQVLGTKLEL